MGSLQIPSHAFQSQGEGMAVGNQIRILTVDDHPVLREGIAAILASEADMVMSPNPVMDLKRSTDSSLIIGTLC